MTPGRTYTTQVLSPDTWDDFARLVGANNGVWGGCWCMGFHPEGVGKGHTAAQNREAKQAHVRNGTVHQVLVYDGHECVGWCQYGPPAELPNIKNRKAYAKDLSEVPDWRIGCMFTGKGHRRNGVAGLRSTVFSPQSKRLAAGSSRPIRNRSKDANPSAVPTSTPGRRICSKSSASNETGRSRSGAG